MLNKTLSKDYTLFVKGIAIIILCWHHLYWHNVTLPISFLNTNFMDLTTVLSKVCVALFTLLSGYGMNESFRRKNENYFSFSIKHIRTLLINYWWVYIPMFILSFWFHSGGTPLHIYNFGSGRGWLNLLLDFFGIRALIYSPTLNNTWWYIEAVFFFYLLFPIFHFCMIKCVGLLLLFSSLPVMLATDGIIWTPLLTSDREIFYIFPFIIGMCLSQYGILNKGIQLADEYKKEALWGTITVVIASMILRTKAPMLTDIFYGLMIILLTIVIKSLCLKAVNCFFEFLGKYSMDIFLIHSFIYWYFPICRGALNKVPNIWLRFCVLLFVCLLLAIILELGKCLIKGVNTKIRGGG